MKNKENYVSYNKKTNRFLIAAIILIIIGIAGLSEFIESYDFSNLFLALLVFILPGCICAYNWYKRKGKIKEYKKYFQYVNSRRKVQLDDLSNKFGTDLNTINDILSEMINIGMIDGYLNDDELIIKSKNKDIEFEEEKAKETKVVKCKECGAKNTVVVGEKKECEYCGSLLQ